MQNSVRLMAGLAILAGLLIVPTLSLKANAAGEMPDKQTCASTRDPIVAGGCVATDRNKGNCMACHRFDGLEQSGLPAGNVGSPLVAMKARYPDKKQLRDFIWDPTQLGPRITMPPYGKHGILTEREIELVVDWLHTL
ncbi:MAG: sulfur oxidation c-type cytochrome SoxX [Acidiferrobacterales bacterium]